MIRYPKVQVKNNRLLRQDHKVPEALY